MWLHSISLFNCKIYSGIIYINMYWKQTNKNQEKKSRLMTCTHTDKYKIVYLNIKFLYDFYSLYARWNSTKKNKILFYSSKLRQNY